MGNAIYRAPCPENEAVLGYAPRSPEREDLKAKLAQLKGEIVEIPVIIGGKEIRTGRIGECRCPHDHGHLLARYHMAGPREVELAIQAAAEAWTTWSETSWQARSAIALNLPAASALMGNTVLWKPASTAVYPGYFLMKLYEEAGLPQGVINFLPGPAGTVGDPALRDLPWPGFISPVLRLPSGRSGNPWGKTSGGTAPTPGSWGRPAARISSSSMFPPTSNRWYPT